MSILSDKDEDEQSSHENSFKSRFSDNGNDDESINSNAEDDVGIGDVRNNSAQATIEEVSIPVISAPIELNHMIISTHSRHSTIPPNHPSLRPR